MDLAIRRQAALWKRWQPWLGLFLVIVLAANALSGIALRLDIGVFQQLRTYLKYGEHFENGVTFGQDVFSIAALSLALFLWSWTSAFALASLSGRAFWLTAPLFYVVVVDSFFIRLILSGAFILAHPNRMLLHIFLNLLPLGFAKIVFLSALLWGARQGLRRSTLEIYAAVTLAITVVILTALVAWTGNWYETAHETWSSGTWHVVPWTTRLPPLFLVSLPALYLLVTSVLS